ncbi:MAG: response regulator transcription factor [Cytophagaceae bacterium]|jgi:DNA-binding response OmpR family regulator|nr:response regulator transcription factor [Cytophagaceae bacterium]MBK9508319.1 response regulator transcription factor [Cytophagaceae bacterium]MBK9934015.1 response regulator transcription factor [Cytophagaceae bacterium]MBL0300472.1 response regulator transcription factor [Cytophagaceae bacterium]MBL0327406.1 response regulator transcription factor [Cytophagaceae bacterium]
MKVLIAEDNELLRKSLTYFLSSKGFEITEFDNGSDAIESLSKHSFELIITDINLPGASGMEITQFVRKTLQSDIPIIVFTASNIEEIELESFDMGANEFIPKPISPSVLLVRINKLLKTSSGN